MHLWYTFLLSLNKYFGPPITSYPNNESTSFISVPVMRIVTSVSRHACSTYYLLSPEPADDVYLSHPVNPCLSKDPLFPAPPYVAPALPVLAAISLPYYPHVPVPGSNTFMRLFLLFKMSCVVPILFGVC
uniref:Uncharacterized protein n=1 Tax=Cacopsylla melanoneura TaxID=428564 RepID=A0A8D9DQX9_9HEMI